MKKIIIVIIIFLGYSQVSSSQELKSSFNINPIGLLQFGPIFQYEASVGGKTCLVPYIRYTYAGLASHLVWTEFEEDSELSPGSIAFGLGSKTFTQADANSMYYGAFLDYAHTKANYAIGFSDETEEISSDLSVAANFGYRWRTNGSMYFNLGLISGLTFTLKDEERFVSNNELYMEYNETTFLAMLEFSFGWEH